MAFVRTPKFVEPPGDARLWRYMDLPKYLHMLTTSTVRFTRSDLLGDSFEGSTTLPTKQQMIDFLFQMFPQREDAGQQVIGLMNNEVSVNTFSRTHAFINSWHANEGESEAMWKIYSREFGIAIVSSMNRLQKSFNTEETLLKGLVTYLDYQKDKIPPGNYLSPFLHKRLSFKHEQEFRLLLWHKPEELGPYLTELPTYEELSRRTPAGLQISANLNDMIEEVHISPYAPEWYFEAVRDLTKRLGFTFGVSKSSLDPQISSPIF